MYLFLTAYLLLAIPSAAAVLRQKQTPVVAIAWLLAIVLLPIGGSLFYLLAGYRKPVRDVPPTDSPAGLAGIEPDAVVRLFDARPLPQPRGTAPRRRRSLRRADLLPCRVPAATSISPTTSSPTTASATPSPTSSSARRVPAWRCGCSTTPSVRGNFPNGS